MKLYSVEQRVETSLDIFENDSDDEEISEDEENLFMETVTSEDDSDVEGEVDLKAKLVSAFEELRKSRMKNNSLKEFFLKYLEEQKSKEEVKTFQEELHNSRQQIMASIKEAKSLKQVVKFKRELERLKYQQYANEKLKEKIKKT